jgi:hypothetical protein
LTPIGANFIIQSLLVQQTALEEAIEMDKLLIDVGQQGNGCVFALYPIIQAKFKEKITRTTKFSRVYVSYEGGQKAEELVGAMSQQIITLLTGLPEPTIQELGGFAFRNPVTGEEIFKREAKNGKTG